MRILRGLLSLYLLMSALFPTKPLAPPKLPAPPALPAHAEASLELYGTFHAMGVIVHLTNGDDPNGNASAAVAYRSSAGGTYQAGFPLSRVAAGRFVGSLFWLEPGKSYDVRISLHDPDGGPLDGLLIDGSAATRAEITIPAPLHSYYVSPTGSGTACSLALPCSLGTGIGQAQPGDEVVLRGGVYYQGGISLPRAGASNAPLVIRGYPGEFAVLDGADPAVFTWISQGGGVYRTTVNAADPHLVLAGGQRLLPYQSLADLQGLVWGIPGLYADGAALYVRLAGDADPNSVPMQVSRENNAFFVDKDFVYFLNLTFRHYGQGDYAKALYFYNGSDNLVQGSTFAFNDLGIGFKYDSQRNLIQDNEFYDSLFDWPWDAFYAGISLSGGGIRFYDPATGRGNVIRRNVFHDYFDGFGACPNSSAAETNETDVYDNQVYNAGDDGMETDGQCSNVRIWGNRFHDVLTGISLAPVYTGPVYAIRNLIYRTGVGNNDYSGTPFKFNSGYDQSGPMYLFQNTADAALPGNNGLYIKAPGSWDLIYARNNVWSGTDFAINNYNEQQPVDLDFDDLYTSNPSEFVYWGSGPDRHMYDLATFRSLTGQEAHGLNASPDFSDPPGGDYALNPGSSLIDAGQIIPGINDGYSGAGPDIGAFEYQGFGFTLAADPPSQAILPGEVAVYRIRVEPAGGFTQTVSLVADNPSTNLALSLSPAQVKPPGQATLVLTDTLSSLSSLPGLWYTIPITGASGGIVQSTQVKLLVGGARLYLPVLVDDALSR